MIQLIACLTVAISTGDWGKYIPSSQSIRLEKHSKWKIAGGKTKKRGNKKYTAIIHNYSFSMLFFTAMCHIGDRVIFKFTYSLGDKWSLTAHFVQAFELWISQYSIEHRHNYIYSSWWWHGSDDGGWKLVHEMDLDRKNVMYQHYSCTCGWRCNGLELCSCRISCFHAF